MAIDIADVFKDCLPELNLTPYHKKIVKKLTVCQTAELGTYLLKCTNSECSNTETMFKSCKSAYCPKCGSLLQLKWGDKRMDEALPVEYMNIVVKAPPCLRDLIQYNARRGLNALSNATKQALHNTFAGGLNQLGVLATIHTNTQLLNYSPHIHCLIPKGYINADKTKWIQIKDITKRAHEKLAIQVKINLLKELKRMNEEFPLTLPANDINISVDSILEKAKKSRVRVHIEDNVSDINHAIKYLADKTKKAIINNDKIVDYKDNIVTVTYSDRKDKNTIKEKDIDALLFLKRFVLHILPSRFTRIRYYGFLSNSCKKSSLDLCRELISKANIVIKKISSKVRETVLYVIKKITDPPVCYVCRKGVLILDGL